jgi:hypothetical protein
MERNIPLKSLTQKAIGKRGVQAPVVMQEAGRAFGHGEALDQVVVGEIFEGESGVVPSGFSEWREFEELKYLTVRANVGKGTPQYTRKQGRRP